MDNRAKRVGYRFWQTSLQKKVRYLQRKFSSFKITKVPRKDNSSTDALSNLASANPKYFPSTKTVETMKQPSILNAIKIVDIEFETSWVDQIINSLVRDTLLGNPVEAKTIKFRVAMFTMIDG
ncbi:RNase H domain-containing protein [Abeliophyllum distichum]|uniref:RNase H domain-containing protein n=1 Tax=Abeliophyllum distichum TaxID=126358 RepID=A0ABD1TZG1_9LAMI